jgi:hypothetical protein
MVDVTGNYTGTIQDSVAGAGTITASLAQTNAEVTGTFKVAFKNVAQNNSGSVSGTISGATATVTLTPSVTTSCPFKLTAQVQSPQISGTYAAFNCQQAVSGTIAVTRQ